MTNLIEREIAVSPEDTDVVVSIENVSKKFCRVLKRSLLYGVQDIFTELVGKNRRSDTLRPKEFWAIKDVSFQLRRGEALGLVGSNGAGKSTLLRIISGLIKPDTGCVQIRGRVAPLIALGAGFNPILTGRENIYANMSILGLSTKEIEDRFQEVIDFAEIEDAIDAPVQTYSSGMAARLGFACAVHIEPDILLIDEVLAVGDIKFRMKCHRRLAKLREKGSAFILVSHNAPAILNVCNSAVYLSKGKLITSGSVDSVLQRYEEDLCLGGTEKSVGPMFLPEKPESESTGIDIVSLCFKDRQENIIEMPISGEPASLCVACKVYKKTAKASLCITITAIGGENERILYLTSGSDNEYLEVFPGTVELQMYMPFCCLVPGVYNAKIFIKEGAYSFDAVESFRFTVKSKTMTNQSLFYQPRQWKVMNY
ncbi:ABC transporter ATP-binding protein [aff. Roholtiella sp. LEGE 12411]|uniref:ABC transporter ATP-binding protein n=1 Tax=aff. Roholtiella sp. LEGE 12411 TaxID=1828822 RepID=UPI001882AE0B|nr:polysaccharide ABC transporter ATP-binding protein [aff. Roholtiella sp. LEGE 12411]MBE9034931.1 ATP-binding cassette domain-containing protein [aff. Roholtiella sp. LEGE 12411]